MLRLTLTRHRIIHLVSRRAIHPKIKLYFCVDNRQDDNVACRHKHIPNTDEIF